MTYGTKVQTFSISPTISIKFPHLNNDPVARNFIVYMPIYIPSWCGMRHIVAVCPLRFSFLNSKHNKAYPCDVFGDTSTKYQPILCGSVLVMMRLWCTSVGWSRWCWNKWESIKRAPPLANTPASGSQQAARATPKGLAPPALCRWCRKCKSTKVFRWAL